MPATRSMQGLRVFALAIPIAVSITCVSPVGVDRQPVAAVSVALATPQIEAGGSTMATAVLRDARGDTLRNRATTWASSNELVAVVDPSTGMVTAVADGTADIIATSEGVSGIASCVVYTPVASVSVTLESSTVYIGATTRATAITRDRRNSILTGREIAWSSSNTSVATVDAASGVVTAVGVGTALIRATSEEVTGETTIEVRRVPVASMVVTIGSANMFVGATTTANASPRDASNAVLADRIVTWSSSDPIVATVDPTSGAVMAKAPGTASIIATSEGVSGEAVLTVTPVPVALVTVTLTSPLVAGSSATASAVTLDAANNVLTGRAIVWSSSEPTVATVHAGTGAVTALAPGTSKIIATSEGISGQATLAVTPVPVASVSVTVAASSIIAGTSTTASAETRDAANNVLTGRVIAWSSSDPTVVTVDAGTGAVAGVAPGAANVVATSEGITGQATLMVTPVPVASVTVSLTASTITVGTGTLASAITRDGGNNILTGRVVTWSTSDPTVATVDAATGAVTCVAPGTVQIIATSEGVDGAGDADRHAGPGRVGHSGPGGHVDRRRPSTTRRRRRVMRPAMCSRAVPLSGARAIALSRR